MTDMRPLDDTASTEMSEMYSSAIHFHVGLEV